MSQNGRDVNHRGGRCSCGNHHEGTSEIPSGEWSCINEAADKFELAWKRGPRPLIEDHLAGVAEPRRTLLLQELLRVERELRLREGEEPCPEDYGARLPRDSATIEAVFAESIRVPSLDDDEASPLAAPPATVSFIPTIQRGVLAVHSDRVGARPPVMLRDTWPGEGPLPMVRPKSSEMPAPHDGPGRLQLFGEIARGGMGAVLKGRDPDLGRDLAVKVLLDAHRDNPELVSRFVEEAQIAGQLQHPGVVPVYELGQFADSRPYFSMKLVRGRTLTEVLRDRPDPSHELSSHVAIWLQICQTMAYAHARGVIHRDLKPSNVMLGNFGEVQVMDWGLAKVMPRGGVADDASTGRRVPPESAVSTTRSDRGSESDLSLEGVVLGTPSYMAPEQARGETDRLDERCDVFALGSILCEILTGKPAFSGRTSGEIHLKATQADLSEAMARLQTCGADAELITVAKDCLAADLEKRPRDAGAVAARGIAYVGSLERRMRQAELERAAETVRAEEAGHRVLVERQRRRYQLGLAASVLILSVMGGLSCTYWMQQRQARAAQAALALSDATHLRDEAIAEPNNEQRWLAAEHAIADVTRAFAEERRSEVTERLAAMRTEVQAGLKAARRDRTLLQAVNDVRSKKQDLRHSGADARYTQAFRDADLDIDGESPEEIGAKLRVRPGAIAGAVAALDDWALERRAGKQPVERWRRPLAAARAADPDPFRDRVRAAMLQRDRNAREKELREIAKEPKAAQLPPSSALLLAAGLREIGAGEPAETLLRAVAARHPDDVWANYELATTIQEFRPTARDEIVRYFSAARALQPETAHLLGHLLETMWRADEALAVFADLCERRPHDSHNLACYGDFLNRQQMPDRMPDAGRILEQAVHEARDEVRLQPDDASAHRNLALALKNLGQPADAVVEYREALRLEPDDLPTQLNLGSALALHGTDLSTKGAVAEANGKFAESVAVHHEVIRAKPDYAVAHFDLAGVLQSLGKLDEASAEYREAIRLKPDLGQYHVFLGLALHAQKRHEEAIAEIRLAQEVDPGYPQAHCSLGMVLYQQGDYVGALAEARKGQEMNCKQQGKPYTPDEFVQMIEQAIRFLAIVKGDDRPKDVNEQVKFALVGYNLKHHAASALLWKQALQSQPDLAKSRKTQHPYNAACAAALAAAGQGVDNPPPDEAARTKLRRQAITWLKAELQTWDKFLDSGKAEDRKATLFAVGHWLEDADVASLRGEKSLAKLPEAERDELRAIWSGVDALLARAKKPAGK